MRVLLQDKISKRYYAGPHRWVEGRAEAMDFGQIESAAKAYTEESARFAEIILDGDSLAEDPPGPGSDSAHPPRPHR